MKTARLVLLVVIGCASQQATTPSPSVAVTQLSHVARLPVTGQAGLPVDYQIEVSNPLDEPVTLTSVELETVGASGGYSMKRVRHSFSLVVKPHATVMVPIRAWVHRLQETETGDVNAPVTLRGEARFSSSSGGLTTPFVARVQ